MLKMGITFEMKIAKKNINPPDCASFCYLEKDYCIADL